MVVHHAPWREIDPVVGYHLLALRSAVFVVEQDCVYLDADGRDVEPAAVQWWVTDADRVVACLRVLDEPAGVRRIGRVVTASVARGRGLAGQLMAAVLADDPGREFVLSAQEHLTGWYAGFGFVAEGEPYVEDGIPHRAMRRPARPGDGLTPGAGFSA
ncbi:MAG: GNAT family N-acetyltransferase [Propionibacteriaceae bacterium]|nr:GNAT family N-acetyltransferase [Propionibacteriaceae bacterium]